MSISESQIDRIWQGLDQWFQPGNEALKKAMERTAGEGYFSIQDITYAISALRKRLHRDTLHNWVRRASEHSTANVGPGKILCLHAGNIPMVGFQDLLAVMLSGNEYYGKISTKDPYLLPALLNYLKSRKLLTNPKWSTQLSAFKDSKADAVLFSGSRTTVPKVKAQLKQLNIESEATSYLIRDAHFSIAYIQDEFPKTMKDLTEAVLRYSGMGCRSVAVVVAPFGLDDIKCHFTDYIESFWLKNLPHKQPPPKLQYMAAYNKAVERPSAWLDYFLIQEGGLQPEEPFTLYWVEGGQEEVSAIAREYQDALQNIYVTRPGVTFAGFEDRIDWLHNAQQPELAWKPDGIDVLEWIYSLYH